MSEAGVLSENVSRDLGLKPWVVCFSAALFFFYIFIQINMFNAVDPYLIRAFHVNAEQLGQISAGYFYGDVLFLFAAGMILDRFSTRRVIMAAMLLTVLGALGFSLAGGFWAALLSRVIIGIAGAFCLLSCVRLVSRWFPPKRMALVIGLIVTMAMLGGMVAQSPLTMLTHAIGWRQALYVDVAIGVVILFLIAVNVKDAPPGYDIEDQKQHVSAMGFGSSIVRVLRNPQNWFGGLFTSMLNLPVFLLGAMWGGMYLQQVHHISATQAGMVTMMLFVGMIFGSPAFGWLSDKMQRRKPAMMIGAILTLASLLGIMYLPHLSVFALESLFFMLGFVSGSQVLGYPLVAESNPLALTGTAEGFASTLIMAGGLTQPLFGWMMDLHWHHHYINHLPVYLLSDFNFALMLMPVAAVIAILVLLLARETHCRHH